MSETQKTYLILSLIALVGLAVLGFFFIGGVVGSTTFGVSITTNPDLEKGLVGHWTFDGPDIDTSVATSVKDRSGNANHGVTGSTTQIAIDTSVGTVDEKWLNASPQVVFISDTNGFVFYPTAVDCSVASTTDGGVTWSAPRTVDPQSDCTKISVWYDRWTLGDDTGNLIHISTWDTGDDDIWYTEFNTETGVISTTVLGGIAQIASLVAATNVHSMTKAENGDLYMGITDNDDEWVVLCTYPTNCTSAGNWSEITSPYDSGAIDWSIFMPLAGTNNIMLISMDRSAEDYESRIYSATSTSWWDWVSIDTNAVETGTYGGHYGATLDKKTGEIYLAYGADIDDYITQDHDIRTAVYNPSTFAWTNTTDVLTDTSYGLTNAKIAIDEITKDIYVTYSARTTIGTAGTANVYYKKSTDGMITWGNEQGPINEVADDIYGGGNMNIMSSDRLFVTWKYITSPNQDDLYGATIRFPRPKTTEGKIGQAIDLEFDNSDYVEAENVAIATDMFTAAAWVKPESFNVSDESEIISIRGVNNVFDFKLRPSSGATTGFQTIVYASGCSGGQAWLTNDEAIATLDEWVHLASVYEGGAIDTVTHYVNGAFYDSGPVAVSGGMCTSAASLGIGRRNEVETEYFDGVIDDARIYERALSAEEIQRLYDLGATTKVGKTITTNPDLESGLVGHWTFDGKDITDSIVDRSGNGNNGGFIGGATTSAAIEGRIGQALNFDGNTGYINISGAVGNVSGTTDGTISAWFRADSGENEYGIVTFSDESASELLRVGLTGTEPSLKVYAACRDAGTNDWVWTSTSAFANQQEWHHLAITQDGNTATLYLDGVGDIGSFTTATDVTCWFDQLGGIDIASIGSLKYNGAARQDYWDGSIDDMRIYDRALSAAEISRLYDLGATTKVGKTINTNPDLEKGLVGHWSFDGKDVDWGIEYSVRDRSALGNHGTTTIATTTAPAEGRIGQAFNFDSDGGGVGYVVVDDSNSLDVSNVTMATWIKPREISITSQQDRVIRKNGSFAIMVSTDDSTCSGGTTGDVMVRINGDFTNLEACGGTLVMNEWAHVIGTYDGSVEQVYLNGILVGTVNFAAAMNTNNNDVYIGNVRNLFRPFDGLIDDVRVYNRVLSADEIQRLYDLGR